VAMKSNTSFSTCLPDSRMWRGQFVVAYESRGCCKNSASISRSDLRCLTLNGETLWYFKHVRSITLYAFVLSSAKSAALLVWIYDDVTFKHFVTD
jgi:hypothetical protein